MNRVRTEKSRDAATVPAIMTDRGVVASYEEDAAHASGTASGVVRPTSEAEVSALLAFAQREGRGLLPQGARSSLTAGATPRGDLVLALEGMDAFALEGDRARVGPGVRLRDLNERLASSGLWFPPVPTYDLCCVGGAVATNAAGAATFKYGAVRSWVAGLRVVLASGDVLAIERGACHEAAGSFEIETSSGVVTVPLPRYRTPPLKKIACGYFVQDGMDLVDLFIGSEGTLGVVTEVLLSLSPRPAGVVTGLASFASDHAALGFVSEVRRESESRESLGVRAIEWADARSLDLLRERGKAPESELPPRGSCFVLWEQELARREDEELALERLDALLRKHDAGRDVRVALPDDERGRRAIAHLREVVPETVNELVSERKRADPGVRKVAGDMVVPFDRLEEMLGHYRSAFARRGLDSAIWGHVSDGNVHANVLARSSADARSGDEALLELGDMARSLGGAPLSEHGVGKSPTKQRLLRAFLGDQAITDMARTKKALDPRGILAPGNIFPRDTLE